MAPGEREKGRAFITMCQLVPLSIMVMLKDIVFQGERRGTDKGRRETSSSFCPLFIVNGCYTDKKHLIRHTHTHNTYYRLRMWLRGLCYGAELHNP